MGFRIRPAIYADSAAACQTVRDSISRLCADDHREDAATLTAWLANKTEANFRTWIGSDHHLALVAEDPEGVCGFGLLNRNGKLAQLYVAPRARFRGVSKALLAALEIEALRLGLKELSLGSSMTALRFYQSAGYRLAGEPEQGFGVTRSQPMSKRLDAVRVSAPPSPAHRP